jgi:hypothetical protein
VSVAEARKDPLLREPRFLTVSYFKILFKCSFGVFIVERFQRQARGRSAGQQKVPPAEKREACPVNKGPIKNGPGGNS